MTYDMYHTHTLVNFWVPEIMYLWTILIWQIMTLQFMYRISLWYCVLKQFVEEYYVWKITSTYELFSKNFQNVIINTSIFN